MANKEKVFCEGLIAKRNDKAPDFVLCNLSFKVEEFKTFLDTYDKNGWVNIKPSENDKRAKNVFITKEGLQKYKDVFEPYYFFMGPIILGISPEDFSATLRVLQKIRKNSSKLKS